MIQLGSVNLVVQDIAAAEKFYVGVLGLTVDKERSNPPSFLLLRAENCMVILQDAKAMESAPDGIRSVELGFQVEDVAAMKEKLGDRARVQSMGWGNAIETEDPNGIRLNLYRLSEPDGGSDRVNR